MKSLIPFALAAFVFPGLVLSRDGSIEDTIPEFDLTRYLGKWYEIARFDHSFERGMTNVTAEYTMRPDGKVRVVNAGWRNGKKKVAEGKAKQPDPAISPSHLEVSFFLFFYSDYNVLMLDTDYQYALVGSRSKNYLWILARKPYICDDVKVAMLAEAEKLGYDVSKFIWVNQQWSKWNSDTSARLRSELNGSDCCCDGRSGK